VEVGLRERKKRATREALIEAALELFSTQGFDNTSVDQIADRVDVSARTFHRYFPAKEHVLFADTAARMELVATLLDADDGTRPVLDVLRDTAMELASVLAVDPRRQKLRFRVIEGNDRLRAHNLRASEEIADLFAAHAADRLELGRGDRLPRLLGTWTYGVLRTAHRRWLDDPKLDMVEEVRAGFVILATVEAATATAPPATTTTRRKR
jgi:AcrR family transcriptional regulator